MAYNFHCYGNIFLHPLSSDISEKNKIFDLYPEKAELYLEIWNDFDFPEGNMYVNFYLFIQI